MFTFVRIKFLAQVAQKN